jgi:SAM-dependent methyltransferase
MIKTVTHDGKIYPEFQTNGNAARFAMPFAKELLQGNGLDIGCNRKDWAFPGAKMIDLEIDDEWDAFNLPNEKYDYIFSSHCLEHINDWVGALDYWGEHLKAGGVMFLYLPHYSQTYWRPWNNRKHVNILTPEFIKDYFEARNYNNILVSGPDLYNAFYGVACK